MKYFIARFFRKVGMSNFFNLVWSIRVNNNPVKIPVIRGLGTANLAGGEKWLNEIIGRLLTDKDVIVDVGANVGQTLIKVKTLVPSAKYIGFEPNPACSWYLQELVRSNNFADCTIIPSGLSDVSDILELSFYTRNEAEGSASMIENFRPNSKVLSKKYVPVFNFDEIVRKFGMIVPKIIKIDVEGAEMEVIKGLKKTIKNYRPFVVFEILPAYSANNFQRINRQNQIIEFFIKFDYLIYRIVKNKKNCLQQLDKIDEISIHSNLNLCDYIAVPGDLANVLYELFDVNLVTEQNTMNLNGSISE